MLLALVFARSLVAQASAVEVSANGLAITCALPGKIDATGSMLRADSDSFDLDLCTPTQDCSAPKVAHFRVSVAGKVRLDKILEHASFVHVQMESAPVEGACRERIAVSGLRSWLGERSHTGRPDEFYLAAVHNWSAPSTGWPITAQVCSGKARDTISISTPALKMDFRSELLGSRFTGDGGEWILAVQKAGSCAEGGSWSYWISRKAAR